MTTNDKSDLRALCARYRVDLSCTLCELRRVVWNNDKKTPPDEWEFDMDLADRLDSQYPNEEPIEDLLED